jgi:hypothetical protein
MNNRKRELEKRENDDMIEQMNQNAKAIKLEIHEKARRELDDYIKGLLK